jgi:hypothetical protein
MTVAITGPATLANTVVASTATRVYGAGMTSVTYVSTGTSTVGIDNIRVTPTAAGAVQVTVSTATAAGVSTTLERYNLTVSATCATGSASVANSLVAIQYYAANDAAFVTAQSAKTNKNSTSVTAATLDADGYVTNYASSADRIANAGSGFVTVQIKDGTLAASAVTTQGVFSASATNGAVIGWADAALALQSSSATTAGPTSGTAQTATLRVVQGTANKDKPITTVVSVYFNGVLYGTRTLNFMGKATKISIDAASSSVSKATVEGTAAGVYEIEDAAGNKLTSGGSGVSGTTATADNNPVLATSGTVVDPIQQIVSSVSAINDEASTMAGTFEWTCGTGSGSAAIYLTYRFSDLTTVKTANYNAACGYAPVNYKASLDKASYAPGEIATLTITATDKNGKAVYDVDETAAAAGNAVGSTAKPISISLPQMTAVVAPTNTNTFSGSAKTYKFTVGTTDGSFAGVVDLPLYNTTTYAQTAQTVSYKVAGSAGVSNADVLKAIVSLIASINKQIAALQKALLKK